MIKDGDVYVSEDVFTRLCPEGKRLYEAWQKALEMQAARPVIYRAMQAYFVHRNGNNPKNYSKLSGCYCPYCTGYITELDG